MRATEQSLEQELAQLLGNRLGASIITQTSYSATRKKLQKGKDRKQIDVMLKFPDYKIVLEVEVGQKNLLTGVAQAVGYEKDLEADGSITIAYPETVRREVETQQDILDLVIHTNFSALVLTPFLRQSFRSVNLDDFCQFILRARVAPEPTDLNLVVSVLRESVDGLVLKLRRGRGIPRPALEKVVNQFELFSKLAGTDSVTQSEMLESIACDLIAYISVNQILLYFLLKKTLGLPSFNIIEHLADLRTYFKHITDIDYRAVFIIDVVEHLPKRCLPELNKIILAFNHLQPENMKHDLLGRMFHEFLPFNTRKIFAAFYTKPVAAEMLASLAVRNFPSVVVEPACGSGTLLVAAYHALRNEDPKQTHSQTLRKIYALDIMPFAAHLAALNLTLQDLESHTEKVNVGIGNSLSLAQHKLVLARQETLFDKVISRRVDVDQKHEEEIKLPENANVIIMNPPYTDRGRLNDQMLAERIHDFRERQNYWAYFLSLAHDLLAPGGVIAAVLPRLFLAGSTSKEVRQWLFNTLGYELRYIVRTTKEFAFSESAAFRDFLIVLQKPTEPLSQRMAPCKVVYLNRSVDEITLADAGEIGDTVVHLRESRDPIETADVTVFTVPQATIRDRCENLWFMVGFENPRNAHVVSRIWTKLFDLAKSRLAPLRDAIGARSSKLVAQLMPRGFEPKPSGLYSAIFAVRPLDKKRVNMSDMIINDVHDDRIVCGFMGHTIELPKDALQLGIKTASYFRRFEITPKYGDWVLKKRCKVSTTLQKLSDVKINYSYIQKSIDYRKTNLLVTKRLDLSSPGSTFIAFFSENEMVSPNTFYSVKCAPPHALVICLWINSVFGIIQFLNRRMETRGSYCDILKEDLIEFDVPSVKQLPDNLLKWYEENRETEFPTLAEQFTSKSPRRGLDRAMMLWMGWKESEVDTDLDALYVALHDELQLLKSAMKG